MSSFLIVVCFFLAVSTHAIVDAVEKKTHAIVDSTVEEKSLMKTLETSPVRTLEELASIAEFLISKTPGWINELAAERQKVKVQAKTKIAAKKTKTTCDASKVKLLNFEAWRREAGFWTGAYSFYSSTGYPYTPYPSSSWPYPYQPYSGVIFINITGNHLRQRNIFVYPPLSADECASRGNPVKGSGVCGVNGNEKIFSADQYASDCEGNLAGPYQYGAFTLDTSTNVLSNDTVLYQVRFRKTDIDAYNIHIAAGALNQNQLTSLPGNGIRVRTAQTFNLDQTPQAASFYRETKASDKTSWLASLAALRAQYNILPADYCAFDQLGYASGTTCADHFGFDI